MPRMSGEQLAAAIKGETPIRPVILLTGFGDLLKATGETPEEVSLVLRKPITRAELQQAMATVVTG